jgi:hypothetical protein
MLLQNLLNLVVIYILNMQLAINSHFGDNLLWKADK